MKRVTIILALLLSCLICCCKISEYIEFRRIIAAPEEKRVVEFNKLPIQKQIDTYLYAQFNLVESAYPQFAEYLAFDGVPKIDLIVGRLDKSSESREKVALIRVLDRIDKKCSCIRNNAEVMTTLDRNTPKIEDSGDRTYRNIYLRSLRNLRPEEDQ
ncbi:MAG: hypothetical protein ABI999_18720 [Acidobacteriota bacterium]